jgi:hypothetical protein
MCAVSLAHSSGVKLPSNGWHLQSNSTIPDATSPVGGGGSSSSGSGSGSSPTTGTRRRRRGQALESPHDTATISPSAHTDHELRKALHDAYRPFNEELYGLLGR